MSAAVSEADPHETVSAANVPTGFRGPAFPSARESAILALPTNGTSIRLYSSAFADLPRAHRVPPGGVFFCSPGGILGRVAMIGCLKRFVLKKVTYVE